MKQIKNSNIDINNINRITLMTYAYLKKYAYLTNHLKRKEILKWSLITKRGKGTLSTKDIKYVLNSTNTEITLDLQKIFQLVRKTFLNSNTPKISPKFDDKLMPSIKIKEETLPLKNIIKNHIDNNQILYMSITISALYILLGQDYLSIQIKSYILELLKKLLRILKFFIEYFKIILAKLKAFLEYVNFIRKDIIKNFFFKDILDAFREKEISITNREVDLSNKKLQLEKDRLEFEKDKVSAGENFENYLEVKRLEKAISKANVEKRQLQKRIEELSWEPKELYYENETFLE